jgi:hypothetical protein
MLSAVPKPLRPPARLGIIAIAGFCAALSSAAHADMRCGDRIIQNGDTRAKVNALCGDPADVSTSTLMRRPSYVRHGHLVYFGNGFVEVPVELWTYNFGPNRLMQQLRFVDGVIDDITTLGYGYNEDR